MIYDPVGGDVFDESVRSHRLRRPGSPGDRLHIRADPRRSQSICRRSRASRSWRRTGRRIGGAPVPGEGSREARRRSGEWPTKGVIRPHATRGAAAGAMAGSLRSY
ncbi:hypothetical protein ACRAWD_17840 [Caulobacter segnis]